MERFALRFRLDQSQVLVAAVLAILAALTVVPLAVLLVTSLQAGSALTFPPTGISFARYQQVFGDVVTYRLLLNSLSYAAGSLALAIPVAVVLAWLVGRTDLPGRSFVRNLAFSASAMPGLITALGWILLASPRSGALNVLLRAVARTGPGDGPLDIYTLPGMIFVTAAALIPGAFTLLIAVFERMDPSLEEASTAAGAHPLDTVRRVTLPLLLPGILSAAMFYLVVLLQAFEIPLAIGTSAHVPVLTTRIFILSQPDFGTIDYGLAGAFATIALALGLVLLFLYFQATKLQARFQVVGGRGYQSTRVSLRAWKGPALALVALVFFIQLGLPFLILFWTALLPYYQPPSAEALHALSFNTFRGVLTKSRVALSVGNTALLVVSTATVTMVLASVIAWLVQDRRTRISWLMDVMGFLPLAIPGVVISFALLLVFVRTPLYGTVWIIVVGHLVAFLPFCVRLMGAAFLQLRREVEEAARASGAGPLRAFATVVLPLVFSSFVDGWIWVFAHSMRDFTFPLMFRSTQNAVIATLIWELWNQPDTPSAAALSVLLVLVVLLASVGLRAAAGRLVGRRGLQAALETA